MRSAILCLFLFVSGVAAAAPPQQVYVRAGHLLDVHSGRMLSNQAILVDGKRIARVGPASEIPVPAGAKVIDLSRATVLPGLIDAHEHLFLTGELHGRYDQELLKESWQYRTIEAVVNARKDLEAGFTTMRDLETEGAMYSDVDVKTAINNGLIPSPRLQVATRALSVTGGYALLGYSPEVTVPTGVQICDGPIDCRKAVRTQLKYGADWVKVYGTYLWHFTPDGRLINIPTFRPDELRAVVDEAHWEGHKVAYRAYGGPGLQNCLDAHVDSIEHGLVLTDAQVRQMVRQGTWYCPTLYVYEFVAPDDLKETGGKYSRARLHVASFQRALRAGVKIAFGTDAGPFPHGTQAVEFTLMVKYGMTPLQAIQAATTRAALLLGWSDRIGSIDPGKYADLIAVDGNPLDNVALLEHVHFVMKGGRVIRDDFR